MFQRTMAGRVLLTKVPMEYRKLGPIFQSFADSNEAICSREDLVASGVS